MGSQIQATNQNIFFGPLTPGLHYTRHSPCSPLLLSSVTVPLALAQSNTPLWCEFVLTDRFFLFPCPLPPYTTTTTPLTGRHRRTPPTHHPPTSLTSLLKSFTRASRSTYGFRRWWSFTRSSFVREHAAAASAPAAPASPATSAPAILRATSSSASVAAPPSSAASPPSVEHGSCGERDGRSERWERDGCGCWGTPAIAPDGSAAAPAEFGCRSGRVCARSTASDVPR